MEAPEDGIEDSQSEPPPLKGGGLMFFFHDLAGFSGDEGRSDRSDPRREEGGVVAG